MKSFLKFLVFVLLLADGHFMIKSGRPKFGAVENESGKIYTSRQIEDRAADGPYLNAFNEEYTHLVVRLSLACQLTKIENGGAAAMVGYRRFCVGRSPTSNSNEQQSHLAGLWSDCLAGKGHIVTNNSPSTAR